MNFYKFITVGIIFFLTPIFISADFQGAMQSYQQEDFEAAYIEFKHLAEVGNTEAIYNIGVMHYQGQYVEKNLVQAYAWMKLANSFDEYYKFSTVKKKLSEAEKQEAEFAYQKLNTELGLEVFNENYKPVFSNEEKKVSDEYPRLLPIVKVAPNYPSRAAERGREGTVLVGYEILNSGAVTNVEIINQNTGIKDFFRASIMAAEKFKYKEISNIDNLENTIFTFKTNRFTFDLTEQTDKKKTNKELARLLDAVKEGNSEAEYYLAVEAGPVYDIKISEARKLELLLFSASNGYAKSQLEIGFNLLSGYNCKMDIQKGVNWIIKAAESGDEYAAKLVSRYALLDEI